ncbi:MAG: hypothetical protein AB9846_11530 [Tenuifilaceae bacterium]
MKNYYLIIIVAFATTLTSCFSAKPVIRVNPEETQTTWEKGKEYVSYKKGEYEAHLSYHGSNNQYLIFDVDVVNKNGEEFLVAPENIKIYTGKWDNSKQAVIYDNTPIRAIDPEMELLKIDMANSKAEASMKNAQIAAVAICAVAVPLSIAASISDINNSNSSDYSVSNTELVDAGVNIALGATAITQISQEAEIISLNDNQYTWKEASLRKTTLSPGYSIRGLVFFPIPDIQVRKILIEVPTPNENISFKYNIVLYYPN